MKVKIKEQTLYSKAAARFLKSQRVAVVFGRTIHLWNISRKDFLKDSPWVVHELEHVRQFQHYGVLRFSVMYLIEITRNGYYNNRFEKEAREAEMGEPDLEEIEFV